MLLHESAVSRERHAQHLWKRVLVVVTAACRLESLIGYDVIRQLQARASIHESQKGGLDVKLITIR
jgi:hypothetical protein